MRNKQRVVISVRKANGKLMGFELIAHERIFRGELALGIYPVDLRLPHYEFQIIQPKFGTERVVGILSHHGELYVPVVENLNTDDRAEQVLTTWAVMHFCCVMSVVDMKLFLQENSAKQKDFLNSAKSVLNVHCAEFVFF